jgi:hypothetical protein
MFNVGDLVTVDSETLRLHIHENIHEQWEVNQIGIVLAVEGHKGGAVTLVKVHFESLRDAYWLYAKEVFPITP